MKKKVFTRIKYSFIKILTGSDLSNRRLPLMAAESAKPGPVVWLTGCGHGDEVTGMVIIQEVFKSMKKQTLLKGSVYAFPLMNPIGFETSSRNITFSKEDLNRSFPGNKNGSLAERIADKIFSTITQTNPDLVIDLHNDWKKSIPYALLEPYSEMKYKKIYERVARFSEKTGFIIVADTEHLLKSLSNSLIQHRIPALTLELGESFVVNEKNVEYGVKSVMNVLTHLGMVEETAAPFYHPLTNVFRDTLLLYSDQPVSSTSGIIRFLAQPGDIVEKGRPVAKIYNSFGKLMETIHSLNKGIVLGYSDYSVAFPGAPVAAFGISV